MIDSLNQYGNENVNKENEDKNEEKIEIRRQFYKIKPPCDAILEIQISLGFVEQTSSFKLIHQDNFQTKKGKLFFLILFQ